MFYRGVSYEARSMDQLARVMNAWRVGELVIGAASRLPASRAVVLFMRFMGLSILAHARSEEIQTWLKRTAGDVLKSVQTDLERCVRMRRDAVCEWFAARTRARLDQNRNFRRANKALQADRAFLGAHASKEFVRNVRRMCETVFRDVDQDLSPVLRLVRDAAREPRVASQSASLRMLLRASEGRPGAFCMSDLMMADCNPAGMRDVGSMVRRAAQALFLSPERHAVADPGVTVVPRAFFLAYTTHN